MADFFGTRSVRAGRGAVFNAPVELRALWAAMRDKIDLPRKQIDAFEQQLALDSVLRSSVTGEVVSSVVTQYLLDHDPSGTLRPNGRSDFPDLYDAGVDYSQLPAFRRGKSDADAETYGAAVKGKSRRPVRVPDGLEVKTCYKQLRVDCHHPHAGLHLVVLHHTINKRLTVADVLVAFLTSTDYRESARNTTATTVKYSFGRKQFVSLLRQER